MWRDVVFMRGEAKASLAHTIRCVIISVFFYVVCFIVCVCMCVCIRRLCVEWNADTTATNKTDGGTVWLHTGYSSVPHTTTLSAKPNHLDMLLVMIEAMFKST